MPSSGCGKVTVLMNHRSHGSRHKSNPDNTVRDGACEAPYLVVELLVTESKPFFFSDMDPGRLLMLIQAAVSGLR